MEPNNWYYDGQNLVVVAAPFVAYFFGIVIRKKVIPGRRSLPLGRQLLLGIPVSLVTVSPFLPVIYAVLNATDGNLPGFLTTLGVIMEHGMLVNETATYHLDSMRKQLKEPKSKAAGQP